MSRFSYRYFETFLLLDGYAAHAIWHLRRMALTLGFSWGGALDVSGLFCEGVPGVLRDVALFLSSRVEGAPAGMSRLRLEYDACGYGTRIGEYACGRYSSLRPVEAPDLRYECKRTDRSALEQLWGSRGGSDDALIVQRGYVTDTTIANLMLLRRGEWFTPGHSLLAGTKRSRYLSEGMVVARPIRLSELDLYERVVAINALRDCEITHVG